MSGTSTAVDWRLIGAILVGLFFFGVAYDQLMARLEARKDDFVAFMVVFGVLVTLGGVALVDWQGALLALGMFAASGLPMIVGSMARSMRKRERELQELRAGNDEKKTTAI